MEKIVGKILYLAMIVVFASIAALIHWLLMRKPDIEKARTKGLNIAKRYLDNPVLAIDYATLEGIEYNEVQRRASSGLIEAYTWCHYLYVDTKITRSGH